MLAAIDAAGPDPADHLNAIGRAYVRFALANPAHFKLMFRSELVHAEKHANAKEGAGSAFDVLVRVADAAAVASGETPSRSLVAAAWSLAHGLATLMLEGKMDHVFCLGESERLAVADEILQQFGRIFAPRT